MILFSRILSNIGILKEDANVNDITDAIQNHRAVKINYKSDVNDTHTGNRIIYPVAYGITTAGNPAIRAFEKAGDTKTAVPAWKLFLVSKIQNGSWQNTQETFNPADLKGFNKDGDEKFSTLYSIAPVKGQEVQIKNNEPVIHGKPITKHEVENGVTKPEGEYSGEDAVKDIINNFQYKNVDNNPQTSYSNSASNKMFAPDTQPITKSNIDTPDQENIPSVPQPQMTAQGTEPVTKGEIDNPENNNAQETLNNMQNLTSRMDNLNKDENASTIRP